VPKDLYNYDCTTKKKVHKLYGAFYKEADPAAEVSHITFDDE
jgi:ATP-dependent RNA helicase DBP3